nr:MAG TPA: hypothetical protein [Caudoviricetes sp.]DAR36816.1 MAG TPA: hypothetical protein [Caudoviricetes sp.]DAY58515.1 MAG TPA: hypothetical protein [Caudoviricetes sp.]
MVTWLADFFMLFWVTCNPFIVTLLFREAIPEKVHFSLKISQSDNFICKVPICHFDCIQSRLSCSVY